MARKKISQQTSAAPANRSISRTCSIIRLIAREDDGGVSLGEVADAVNLPKSSAHRYLSVLIDEGFVCKDSGSGNYRLGLGLIGIRNRRIELLIDRARPALVEIRDKWEETVNLGVLRDTSIIYCDIVESAKVARMSFQRGDEEHIHSTALGKAIVATLPDETVLELLKQGGMPKITARTITSAQRFIDELKRVRRRKYAVDDRENEEDGRCVAVFIPNTDPLAAISVSGLASRLSMARIPEVVTSLRNAAETIAASLPALESHQ